MLARSDGDIERKSRTFNLHRPNESHLVRVADDVLDLDAHLVRRLLRLFRVAQKVRESHTERATTVVSVTGNGASVVPI